MTRLDPVRYGPLRYARAGRFQLPRPLPGPVALGESSGQICPQRSGRLRSVLGVPKDARAQGEDCLNLSVISPGREGRRPVMVFLHGGAFVSGGGLLDWYDGSALAAEADVVVVSINYRLGVLGYLCLDGVSSGNLGLYDQLEALRWVQANIARYGGDPTNVTVFGQSAGAVSIRLLMEMPQAKSLFTRAILQSGPGSYLGRPLEVAKDIGRLFTSKLGQDPRNAPVAELLRAQDETTATLAQGSTDSGALAAPPFYPVLGADSLPALGQTFSENVQGLDVICGWNADDVSAFGVPRSDVAAATQRMLADPICSLADELNASNAQVHTYRLDWRPAGSALGATHCVELPLLLGTQRSWEASPMLGITPWDQVDTLGRKLRQVWGYFARTGQIHAEALAELPLVWDPHLSAGYTKAQQLNTSRPGSKCPIVPPLGLKTIG